MTLFKRKKKVKIKFATADNPAKRLWQIGEAVPKEYENDIGYIINHFLEEARMSSQSLEIALGVSKGTIFQIEQKEFVPSDDFMGALLMCCIARMIAQESFCNTVVRPSNTQEEL